MAEIMKQTPLYQQHTQRASKIINLKGFARPVAYVGHIKEHKATRSQVSLCDVSHMGELTFTGRDALTLVQKIITNDAARIAVGQAQYSVMCDEQGHVIDDLICSRLGEEEFLWVVNVTKVDEDYQWIIKHAVGLDVEVRDISCATALISIQGPNSRETLQKITEADLSKLGYYRVIKTSIYTMEAEIPCIISRTGYTGERGYELYVSRDLAPMAWNELLLAGTPLGIVPCGVAARESLRTEAGLLLNGNDMDGSITPYEANLGRVVKFTKDFIGKEALLKAAQEKCEKILVGLEILSNATVRHGYPIYKNGREIGCVSSGPLSKSLLDRSAGMGFVAAEYSKPGTELEIGIRGKLYPAVVVALPFYEHRVKTEAAADTYSPCALAYTPGHMWVGPVAEGVAAVGVTDFGQRELGDILYLELPQVGDRVNVNDSVGWLDTYRQAWDIKTPVSGQIIAVNGEIAAHPELVNQYPYLKTGLFLVKLSDPQELDALLPHKDYLSHIRELSRYENWTKERRTF